MKRKKLIIILSVLALLVILSITNGSMVNASTESENRYTITYEIIDEEKGEVEVDKIRPIGDNLVVNIPEKVKLKGKEEKEYRVVSIGSYASYIPDNGSPEWSSDNTSIVKVIIPNSVTEIKTGAFGWCKNLQEVIIPNSVTSIKTVAFCYCERLTEITIPNSVTSIGDQAFSYCKSLKKIIIPNSVTSIEKMAFQNCSRLTEATIPKSVTSMGNDIFKGCDEELTIKVYKDSYAHNYAKEHNIKYVILEENIEPEQPQEPDVPIIPDVPDKPVEPSTPETPTTPEVPQQVVSKPFTFTDVKQSDWYYNSVKFVYDRNIILGTTDTTFKPKNKLTRGMLATILWRMEGSPSNIQGKEFPDVKKGQYYYDAVKWASSKGIVSGYENGKFGPNNNITREQLSVILYNYAKYKGKTGKAPIDISKYKDCKRVSSYATEAVKWAIANKIISGKENGSKIEPQEGATRAEASAMIQNYLTYVK